LNGLRNSILRASGFCEASGHTVGRQNIEVIRPTGRNRGIEMAYHANCQRDPDLRHRRHCERSEAIQTLLCGKSWIASLRSQ
jgi:hypothetical protein